MDPKLFHASASRIALLKSVAPTGTEKILDQLSDGSLPPLTDDVVVADSFSRLKFANDLADVSSEHTILMRRLLDDQKVSSLRDVALNYSDDKLEELLAPDTTAKPAGLTSARLSSRSLSSPRRTDVVAKFQKVLFNAEPTAFVQRMLQNGELGTAHTAPETVVKQALQRSANTPAPSRTSDVHSGMARVLQNRPDFRLREHGISALISDPGAFSGILDKQQPAVANGLKEIALAQSLTSDPKALPTLFNSKLSAFRISQLPEDQFVENFGPAVGGADAAKEIHSHSLQVAARNDHALTSILQTVRGTGLAAIDGPESPQARLEALQVAAGEKPEQINLERLFGSLDYCECSDCTSVTSPAAYLVELLQFLRNNNLSPESPWSRWTGQEDFRGSPLDHLFRRRPDIACLELTCANTNVVLPYIDLANEVMESFIYHQQRYASSPAARKQTWIDVFNSSDNADGLGGSSEELLAAPQNVNLNAYQALQQAVYPAANLPYNQPLDPIRQFLKFLGTSRAELLKTFQAHYNSPKKTQTDTWDDVTCPCGPIKMPKPCPEEATDDCSASCENDSDQDECDESTDDGDDDPNCVDSDEDEADDNQHFSSSISNDDQATMVKIHQEALGRAVAAEELGISQEEYIILTKQAFWRKAHFDIYHGKETSLSTYRKRIGVKKDWEYWGLDYTSAADMQDATAGNGLTYVKSQLLLRTGILYSDLVDLLRTNYLNPNMPKGRAKLIMARFTFSYQFLASKIDTSEKHRKARLRTLLKFLEHPVDQDSGFQAVLTASLKKRSCCQLLFQNRTKKPERNLLDREVDDQDEETGKKHKPKKCECGCDDELKDWICKYFESVGKVIVLDSGQGQRLPWEGDIIAYVPIDTGPRFAAIRRAEGQPNSAIVSAADLADGEILVGHIHTNGSITASATNNIEVGYVGLDGVVYSSNGELLIRSWSDYEIKVVRTDEPTGDTSDGSIGSENSKLKLSGITTPTPWTLAYDDCDLTQVRLRHLDGNPVTRIEYDRMHRFIRLWRKLDWSVAEVDAAISAFGAGSQIVTPVPPGTPEAEDDDDVDYDDFQTPCSCGKSGCKKCNDDAEHTPAPKKGKKGSKRRFCEHCGKLANTSGQKPTRKHCDCKPRNGTKGGTKGSAFAGQTKALDISPFLINQIAAVKKIVDLVGMNLLQVLTLWTSIDIHGDQSLYAQLFLKHNILGIDRIFVPDVDGNYLVQSPPVKISEHRPILLTAFNLKPDDLDNIIRIAAINDDLTLENVSAIYRHNIFAKMLGLQPKYLEHFFAIFSVPWTSAEKALELLNLWNKVTDAGFDINQLYFIFKNEEVDPLRPIGPTELVTSRLAAAIYSNLKEIESQHQNINSADDATGALITAKAQLVFSQSIVSDILAFLEGARVYSTNAPTIANVVIPANLKDKLKYVTGDSSTLQSTGQLTGEEVGQAKSVSTSPKWATAVDRLSKQAGSFFTTVLGPIFANKDEARSQLVSGDVLASLAPDSNPTAPKKRLYFLQNFIPFLQTQLSTQSIVATLASAASLTNPITAALLQENLVLRRSADDPGTRARDVIEAIKNDPSSQSSWSGYLVISTTDKYTLYANSVVDDNQPASITINDRAYDFSEQLEDPTNIWHGKPIQLTGGTMHSLEVRGQIATKLSWKTDLTVPSLIPSSFLIPTHATSGVREVLVLLIKASIVINNFNLGLDEVSYFQKNGSDFRGFDWNNLALGHWKRVNAYANLKKSLPKSQTTLLQLFAWAKDPLSKPADIPAQINWVTQWKLDEISNFILPKHFNLQNPAQFANEVYLVKLQGAITTARTISVDIAKLFTWAKPAVSFTSLQTIAADIKTAIRTKYTLSDWDKAIKPTFDTLRQNQSNALVAYLVAQPVLIEQGIVDANSLFEFFLIDPSMCPCMETSRLKQATSSVQLFIQRCLLSLEDQQKGFSMGVPRNLIDRQRWEWMQRYRLWEANRKVYLFPENWIQSSLRDDKSPQFRALESELLQKDVTEQSVLNALKNYLFAVDEISNLQTVAVFVEDIPGGQGEKNTIPNIETSHFFGRPASAPYKYYYRTFDAIYATWTPWTLMQVDVPNYEIERSGDMNLNGCYLVPFSYNGRLIVGLPQFLKKSKPQDLPDKSFSEMAQGDHPTHSKELLPLEYWEIKFGYTELLNGTWKQKVISNQAIWEAPVAKAPEVSEYQFVPELQNPSQSLSTIVYINVLRNETKVGRFAFNGSRVTRDSSSASAATGSNRVFQYNDGATSHSVTSLQSLSTKNTELEYPSQPSVTYPINTALESTVQFYSYIHEPFNHQFLHALVSQASRASSLDQLFGYFQTTSIDREEAWGKHLWRADAPGQYNELYRTYSLYNWELAFHAPMLLAEKLLETQQFDLALKMCHYVFDPFAKGTGVKRYWQMPAFQDVDAIDSLDKLFAQLKPNTSVPVDDPINQWRKNPFEPHVLARLRPVSYMKWTVIKYIEILIAYGDWYFQQNTLEMIPMAIQMYVLASHLYGQRGQKIPRRGKKNPETYLTLLNQWDAFGNAMIQLELEFPFSNQIQKSFGSSNGVQGLANIFGFATNRYFCVPNNDQLSALRDKIDDRLYKIRHCQDIKGVFRILPLYEPPLDVGQLVAATAAGLSLKSVLNDLNAPLPNFKFGVLLGRALELCNELKSLGGAFLSAKEKQDAEALSALRQRHDISIQNLMMEQKKLALKEAQVNLDALVASRKRPEYQLTHSLKLMGQDAGLVPGQDDEWKELKDDIAAPVQDSGLLISSEEKEEMEKAVDAKELNQGTSVIQAIASDLKAFPIFNGHASPFGVGVAACFGPGFIGDVMNGVAQVIRIGADALTFQSTAASRKNQHMRTNQERTQTANSTGYELKNIDKQIAASNARLAISSQEIVNQQKQIDNSQEILDFLRNKYTNEELYSFMEGRVRTLYYQVYQMAYNWARKAEATFRFERGLKDTNFIQPGYWEPGHDGLLSGEALFLGLKNMEAAYHEERGHDFEVSKFISLRQINPLALIQLRENGACEFAIPEILYDMDFPGHYLRKIKAVTLTIPCVVGPYTTVNCTLRLTAHKYRSDPIAKDKRDYLEKSADQGGPNGDPRFDTVLIPISAAAVSSANNDAGVFDLSFGNNERYMPFEGAGAISQWSLTLPSGFRQFDYGTIQDVVMHVRYTSRDGGDKLGAAASGAVADYVKTVTDLPTGLFAVMDARSEAASKWAQFLRVPGPPPAAQERVLVLNKVNERLPVYTKGHPVSGLVAVDIWVVTDAQVAAGAWTLVQGSNEILFSDGPAVGALKVFAAQGPLVIADWTLKLADVTAPVTKLWVMMRYVMK